MRQLIFSIAMIASLAACAQNQSKPSNDKDGYSVQMSDAEWQERLSKEEYRVLRLKGTEPAWSGKYNNFKEKGYFVCAACGDTLFSSEHKYNSGSGWPSFYDVHENGKVEEIQDHSHGMIRTEVVCGNCGGHLGHVFNDGPQPTGQRYCINSVCLDFQKK